MHAPDVPSPAALMTLSSSATNSASCASCATRSFRSARCASSAKVPLGRLSTGKGWRAVSADVPDGFHACDASDKLMSGSGCTAAGEDASEESLAAAVVSTAATLARSAGDAAVAARKISLTKCG